jgi:predicted metal-dependent hydrolase
VAVKIITLAGVGPVHLYKRRGVRSMRLTIGHDGDVRVTMPYWVPYKTGLDFAASKQDWILSQQTPNVPLRHGSRIGKAHHIAFIAEPQRQALATRITSTGEIRVYLPPHLPADHAQSQQAAQRASVRALRQQGKKLLPQRLQTLAVQHGFTYKDVTVKQLKSRWGSCTEQGNIALNSFLMQLPWYLIDYVILHELVHTRIMAHGPVFWDELGKHVPNLPAIRKEMKTHRPALLAQ